MGRKVKTKNILPFSVIFDIIYDNLVTEKRFQVEYLFGFVLFVYILLHFFFGSYINIFLFLLKYMSIFFFNYYLHLFFFFVSFFILTMFYSPLLMFFKFIVIFCLIIIILIIFQEIVNYILNKIDRKYKFDKIKLQLKLNMMRILF